MNTLSFKSVNEAILAYENQAITLHSRIKVRVSKTLPNGTVKYGIVESTLGRFLFNEIIPQDLGFVDREAEGNELLLEVDFHVGKKQLKKILEKVINTHGASATAEVLDNVKAIGYKFSTRAAMTVSISDMTVPPQKPEMIQQAQDTVDKITAQSLTQKVDSLRLLSLAVANLMRGSEAPWVKCSSSFFNIVRIS